MNDTDLGASKPIPQPQPKQRPLQHATVTACGHKLEAGHFPRKMNCEDCWYALFETNAEALPGLHALLNEQGRSAIERMYGRKFMEAFGRYLRGKLLEMHTEQQAEPMPTGPSLEVKGLEEL